MHPKIINFKLYHVSNTTEFVYYVCIVIPHSDCKSGETTAVPFTMLLQGVETSYLIAGCDLKHLHICNSEKTSQGL